MTEEQLDLLRQLIKLEIELAQVGWIDEQVEEVWQEFRDSFKST